MYKRNRVEKNARRHSSYDQVTGHKMRRHKRKNQKHKTTPGGAGEDCSLSGAISATFETAEIMATVDLIYYSA